MYDDANLVVSRYLVDEISKGLEGKSKISKCCRVSSRSYVEPHPLIYYKPSMEFRQPPPSFMCGDSDIFSGRLTFLRSYGSLHA